MSEYLTEQEQIEQLKKWIKQYGSSILTGVLLAVLIIGGWHLWLQHRTVKLAEASAIYDEVLVDRAQNSTATEIALAQKLVKNYAYTPYAKMAALLLAREAAMTQDYQTARQQLQWVIDHGNAPLKQIARIRMARIYITEKNPEQALTLLSHINDKSFIGLINEVKGDAYLAMNKPKEARDAYGLALSQLPSTDVLLRIKYDNLT